MEFLSWLRVWVYPNINFNVVVCAPHIINLQGAVTLCSFTHYWGASFELVFHLMRWMSVIHYRIHCIMVLVPDYPRMRLCLTWHHYTAPLHCGHCFGYRDDPASHLLEHWEALVWQGEEEKSVRKMVQNKNVSCGCFLLQWYFGRWMRK